MEKINCEKCNHVWEYKGNRLMATCPNCMSKVRCKIVSNDLTLTDLKQKLSDVRNKLDFIEGRIDNLILNEGDTNGSETTIKV